MQTYKKLIATGLSSTGCCRRTRPDRKLCVSDCATERDDMKVLIAAFKIEYRKVNQLQCNMSVQGVSKIVYSWKIFVQLSSAQNLQNHSVKLGSLTPSGT